MDQQNSTPVQRSDAWWRSMYRRRVRNGHGYVGVWKHQCRASFGFDLCVQGRVIREHGFPDPLAASICRDSVVMELKLPNTRTHAHDHLEYYRPRLDLGRYNRVMERAKKAIAEVNRLRCDEMLERMGIAVNGTGIPRS